MNIEEMQKFEDVKVQSNLDGYYTIRHNIGEIEHNHRKIHIREVIWDWDLDNASLDSEIMDFISSKLIKGNIAHSIWFARTHKIHAFFELEKYDIDTRKEIRKEIVRHYAFPYVHFIDFGVCSEKRMIRDFYGMHEKTKKQNLCVFEYGEGRINKVPEFILERVLRDVNKATPVAVSSLKLPKQALKSYSDFLAHCLDKKFNNDCFRNQILFKNIAIAVYRLQAEQKQMSQIFKQVALNCKGKKEAELWGWWKWIPSQKHLVKVNWNELKRGGFYG